MKLKKSLMMLIIYVLYLSCASGTVRSDSNNGSLNNINDTDRDALVIQTGHSTEVGPAALTPDSRYMLSASDDGAIILWELASGKILDIRRDDGPCPYSMRFTPDGNYLIKNYYLSNTDIIEVVKFPSWEKKYTFVAEDWWGANIIKISSDGKYLFAFGSQAQLSSDDEMNTPSSFFIWDLSNGREIAHYPMDPFLRDCVISDDSKTICMRKARGYKEDEAGDKKKSLYHSSYRYVSHELQIYDTSSKKITDTISLSGNEKVRDLKISDNGRICTFNVQKIGFDESRIIALDTKSKLQVRLKTGGDYILAPDGESLLKLAKDGKGVERWETGSGKLAETYSEEILKEGAILPRSLKIYKKDNILSGLSKYRGYLFTPDRKYYVQKIDNYNYAIGYELHETQTDRVLRKFDGLLSGIIRVIAGRSGKYFYSISEDNTCIKKWELGSGKIVATYNNPNSGNLTGFAVSDDERYIGVSIYLNDGGPTKMIWDTSSSSPMPSVLIPEEHTLDIEFTADSKYLMSIAAGGNALHDVKNGKMVKELPDTGTGKLKHIPGGKSMLDGIHVFSTDTGRVLHTFDQPVEFSMTLPPSVAVSGNGAVIAIGHHNMDTVQLYDAKTYALIKKFDFKMKIRLVDDTKLFFPLQYLALSFDGKLIAAVYKDNTIRIWNTETGTTIHSFKFQSEVTSLDFTPDTRFLISSSRDASIRLWNLQSECAMNIVASQTEWINFDDAGNFDSSPNGGAFVALRRGWDVFAIDQFALLHNRPDIMYKNVGIGTPEQLNHFYNLYQKRLKKSGFTESDLASDLHVPEAKITDAKQEGKLVTLDCSLSDSDYKLKKYNIFVNDIPLFGSYGRNISGRSETITEKVELTPGKNKIEAGCINEKGSESIRELTMVDGPVFPGPAGTLYYIGFGVSRYKNESLNLKYAHKDALDLATAFMKMKGKNFVDVRVKTLTDSEVTPDAIRQAKQFLNGSMP